MITKTDCMSILIQLEDKGLNIDSYMRQLIVSKEVPLDVLKFISTNKGIEVGNFYEMLRKKHNQNKSPLYTNIVKEITNVEDVVTTLACLLTQIILYSNKLGNKNNFLKEVRAEEISRVLNKYFADGTADDCLSLLKLIKSDLLVLEYIAGRRDLQA